MGHSKATKAWLANLSKASSNSRRPTVEEIPDSEDDGEYLPKIRWNNTVDGLGRFFFMEYYSDSDLDLDLMLDLCYNSLYFCAISHLTYSFSLSFHTIPIQMDY